MTRDAARTKRALLDAAHTEFAEYGIAGARVDRIAAAAGCNKERIYGHFGNKEALFNIVLTESILKLSESVRPGDGTTADYIGRVFDYHRADPTMLRLLMWEALHYRDGLVDQNDHRRTWYHDARSRFVERTGLSEREAGRTLLTLIGIGAWPIAMPQLVGLFVGDDAQSDEQMAELRDFLTKFGERALESR